MTTVAGFDYFEVEFTKDGSIDDRNQVKELTDSLSSDGVTDLIVLAHGWNNDMDEARRLYERLLGSVKTRSSGAELGDRSLAVLAVLWPSKRFAEEELIAGGGASLSGAPDETELVERLEGLKGTFDDDHADENLEKAKSLIPKLGEDKEAQKEFVDLVRASLREDDADDEDASDEFFALPGDEVMARLAIPDIETGAAGPVAGTGGVASMTDAGGAPAPQGGAAGIGDWIENARNAARNLLNFATYYQMKSRGRDSGEPRCVRGAPRGTDGSSRPEAPPSRPQLWGSAGRSRGHRSERQTSGRRGFAHAASGRLLSPRLRSGLRGQQGRVVQVHDHRQSGEGTGTDYPHRQRQGRRARLPTGLAHIPKCGLGTRRQERQVRRHRPQRCPENA